MENLIFDWFKSHWQVTSVESNPVGLLVNTRNYAETTLVITVTPQMYGTMSVQTVHGWLQYARENNLYPLILIPRAALPDDGKQYNTPAWVKGLQAVYFGRVYTYTVFGGKFKYIIPIHLKYLRKHSNVFEIVGGPLINHIVGGFKPMVNDTNAEWNSIYPDPMLNITIFLDNVFWKQGRGPADQKLPFKHGAKEIDLETEKDRQRRQPPPPPPGYAPPRQETPGGFSWGGLFTSDPVMKAAYEFYKAQGRFDNPVAFMFWWDTQGGRQQWAGGQQQQTGQKFDNPHKQAAWEFYSSRNANMDRTQFSIWYDLMGGREEWHEQTTTAGQGRKAYDFWGSASAPNQDRPFADPHVEAAYQHYRLANTDLWTRNRVSFIEWFDNGGDAHWMDTLKRHAHEVEPFKNPAMERLFKIMENDKSPHAYTRFTFYTWWGKTAHVKLSGLGGYVVTDCRGRSYTYTGQPSYDDFDPSRPFSNPDMERAYETYQSNGFSPFRNNRRAFRDWWDGGGKDEYKAKYGNFDPSKPFTDPEIEAAYQSFRRQEYIPLFARDRFEFYQYWHYRGGRENYHNDQRGYTYTSGSYRAAPPSQPKPKPRAASSGPYVARGNMSIYDAYELFGMVYSPMANKEQIKADHEKMREMFKAKSRELHPDTNPNGAELIKEYTLALAIVKKAHSPNKRG